MKITNFLTQILIGGLFLTACNNQEFPEPDGPNGPSGELVDVTLTLKDGTPNVRAAAGTSAGLPEERAIKTIELYVYNTNGSRDNNGYIIVNGNNYNGSSISFSVTAGEKIVLVAVNMTLGEQQGKTLSEMREIISNVVLWNQANSVSPLVIPDGGIPMSGESPVVEVADKTTNNYVVVYISRLFSKLLTPTPNAAGVDVAIKDSDMEELFGDDYNSGSETKFEFLGYAVVNGLNQSYVLPNYNAEKDENAAWDKDIWELGVAANYHSAKYVQEEGATKGDIISIYSGEKVIDNGLQTTFWLSGDDAVFVYENVPSQKTSSGGLEGLDKQTTYAMLIKGTLEHEGKTLTRYWRYNVNRNSDEAEVNPHNAYKILRNAQYSATINRITTKGYATPEEAEDDEEGGEVIPPEGETAIVVGLSLVPWRLFNEGTDL